MSDRVCARGRCDVLPNCPFVPRCGPGPRERDGSRGAERRDRGHSAVPWHHAHQANGQLPVLPVPGVPRADAEPAPRADEHPARGPDVARGPLQAHAAQREPARRAARLHDAELAGRSFEVVRQRTLDFLGTSHAQAAVNVHFFAPFPVPGGSTQGAYAYVIGLAASRGRVYSAFESPIQSYAIVTNSPGLDIDRSNYASIVHRHPDSADGMDV